MPLISDDEMYPVLDDATGAVVIGHAPDPEAPGERRTVQVPVSLIGGGAWTFTGVLSANADYIHVYDGTAYKGSVPLVDLDQDDL